MARLSRIIVPCLAHHVTQRVNRRQTLFFCDEDYQAYLDLLKTEMAKSSSQICALCLMHNDVHLIVIPSQADGLRQSVADAHRRYSARIDVRNRWTGHLWQGRCGSVLMDEDHLINVIAQFPSIRSGPGRSKAHGIGLGRARMRI